MDERVWQRDRAGWEEKGTELPLVSHLPGAGPFPKDPNTTYLLKKLSPDVSWCTHYPYTHYTTKSISKKKNCISIPISLMRYSSFDCVELPSREQSI